MKAITFLGLATFLLLLTVCPSLGNRDCQDKKKNNACSGTGSIVEGITLAGAAAVGGSVVAAKVGTAVLSTAGFTASGIGSATVAAAVQAGIGKVAAGSVFATLQSVGAVGGLAVLGPVGLGAGAIAGAGALYAYFW